MNAALYQGIRPTWTADFLLGDLGGLTLSRATTGTYFDAAGVLQTAAINAARFDHVIGVGDARGLLHEASATNFVWPSNDFASARWAAFGTGSAKVGVNAGYVDPAGGNSFFEWAAGTAGGAVGGAGALYLSPGTASHSAGVAVSLSAFVRTKSGASSFRLSQFFGGSDDGGSSDIAISTTSARYSYTRTVATAGGGNVAYRNNVAGNTGNILCYGVQQEETAYPTSYIPTTTAAVTRSADILSAPPGAGQTIVEYEAESNLGVLVRSIVNAAGFAWPSNAWLRYARQYPLGTPQAYLDAHLTPGGPW